MSQHGDEYSLGCSRIKCWDEYLDLRRREQEEAAENYEEESVNRRQTDIKSKTCDILTWKNKLFLDISSTNTDKIVPSLYQCFETRRIKVFWLLSQLFPQPPFHHLRLSKVLERTSRPSCFTRQAIPTVIRKIFLWIYFPLNYLSTKKKTERYSSVVYSSSTAAILTIETSLCTYACASAS
jgi:hypothetical protein